MNVCALVAAGSLMLAQVAGVNPATSVSPAAPLRVFRSDTPGLQLPVALETSSPKYTPDDFRERGVEGTMALEVTVGPDGRVRDAMLTDRPAAMSPAMEDRAIAVLGEWRFQPATLNGQAVAVRTTITFTTRLR